MSVQSVQTLIEVAESSYWRGWVENSVRKSHGQPGEFYNSLPEEVKAKLRGLTSDDCCNIRFDAISFMCGVDPSVAWEREIRKDSNE